MDLLLRDIPDILFRELYQYHVLFLIKRHVYDFFFLKMMLSYTIVDI